MRKLIYIILLASILGSCYSQRYINTREIQYRDTTIYLERIIPVKLPQDTVYITDTITVVENIANMPKIKKTFGAITAEAEVISNILNVFAYINDSTMLINRTDTVYIKNAIKEDIQTVVIREKYVPGIYKIALGISIAVILFIIIAILKKIV